MYATYIIRCVGEVRGELERAAQVVDGALVVEAYARGHSIICPTLGFGHAAAHLRHGKRHEGITGVEGCSTLEVGKSRLEIAHVVVLYGPRYVEVGIGLCGLTDELRCGSDIGKVLLQLTLVELRLAVGEHYGRAYALGCIEGFHEVVEGLIAIRGAGQAVACQHYDWLRLLFHAAVLHSPAISAVVLGIGLRGVVLDDAGVVLYVARALLARLCRLVAYAGTGVEACFQHTELIALGAVRVANLSPYGSTLLIAHKEVGVLLEHARDVAQGRTVVARLVEQEGTVEEGYHIIGLHGEHVVEVLDGAVVVAHLCTE